MVTAAKIDPQVWVGCLACYNGGSLRGEWLPAADGPEWVCGLSDANGPHEEFWVMDYEGFLGALSGECSPSDAAAVAECLSEFDGPPEFLAAFLADVWLSESYTLADAVAAADDAGFGVYEDRADYAWQLAESCGDIPAGGIPSGSPLSYVDWDWAGRDWLAGMSSARLADGSLLVWSPA